MRAAQGYVGGTSASAMVNRPVCRQVVSRVLAEDGLACRSPAGVLGAVEPSRP